MHAARTCGKMRHVKPHSKAVCILAPPCAHMVTVRFGQSDPPRLNRIVYAGVAKSYCAMREYGQISAKTLGEMRKKRTTAHS